MKKFLFVPLSLLCFLLISCSGLQANDNDVSIVTEVNTEITSEFSSTPHEEIESENVIELGEGYFLEAAGITQENGDSIYYLWHKDRLNLRSAFLVPADSELIHELDGDTLYFMNCPKSQYRIGVSYASDDIIYLGFDISNDTYKDVVKLYEEALVAFGWFEIEVLSGNEIDEDSGYVKVKHDIFYSYETFNDYLKTLFSDDVVQSLLSKDLYKNINGDLYAAPSLGRGTNAFIVKWHYGVKRESENHLVFSVYLEKMTEDFYRTHAGYYPYKDPVDVEQIEIKTYELEKIDGVWKFTTFEYPI